MNTYFNPAYIITSDMHEAFYNFEAVYTDFEETPAYVLHNFKARAEKLTVEGSKLLMALVRANSPEEAGYMSEACQHADYLLTLLRIKDPTQWSLSELEGLKCQLLSIFEMAMAEAG